MNIEFLTKKKAFELETALSFLSRYTGPEEGVIHQIGASNKIEDRDEEMTDLFIELGKINMRRAEIIKKFEEQK
ncbi:MAG: hypothetical protein ABIP51_20585 [Bacteroidia bacterium]